MMTKGRTPPAPPFEISIPAEIDLPAATKRRLLQQQLEEWKEVRWNCYYALQSGRVAGRGRDEMTGIQARYEAACKLIPIIEADLTKLELPGAPEGDEES